MAGLHPATPSSPPTPSSNPFTLSERINTATRPIHSQLNRLILARLPLALPPHTTNPSIYVSGLLQIAPIYSTFETLWTTFLEAPQLPTILNKALDSCEPVFPVLDAEAIPTIPNSPSGILKPNHSPKVCSRTRSLLSHLQLPGLLRAGRLRADIAALTGTPEHKIKEELDAATRSGLLAEFTAHTTRSVDASPHVLLAYAWVLYMALFAGGRYLRASLKEAGGDVDFWHRDCSPVQRSTTTRRSLERRASDLKADELKPKRTPRSRTRSDSDLSRPVPGLSFFDFAGDEDGEDIKREFKKRIAEAEVLLTEGEKEDIIQEAQHIFHFMVETVGELDRLVGQSEDVPDAVLPAHRPLSKLQRDSVQVHKDRIISSKSPGTDEFPPRNQARRPSFLKVLVTNSIATKIVRFNDNWDSLVSPLKTRLSDKISPRVSVDGDASAAEQASTNPAIRNFTGFFPIIILGVLFLAWRYLDLVAPIPWLE